MWETPLTFPGLINAAQPCMTSLGSEVNMDLRQWWLIFAMECMFLCTSSQSFLQKRRCAFKVSPQNYRYREAGNVSGSIQFCDYTRCCVSFYLVKNGELKVDTLACAKAEICVPDETCKPETLFNGRLVKCVCNSDFCNSNINWTAESVEIQHTRYSYLTDEIMKTVGIVVIGFILVLCFVIFAAKLRGLLKEKKESPTFFSENRVFGLCSCQSTTMSETDISQVELWQVVSRGHFASVWKGKFQGTDVAVKVFPAGWKDNFSAEKEVYKLPLMKHAGIVQFLGTEWKPDTGSWFIVLQLAEHGSLLSFLSKHTTDWIGTLKLCQSLSQGLSYLHSDLHRQDLHKPPVAHRDLSSSNVLVKADGTCALSDFGCSTILRSCSAQRCRKHHETKLESPVQMGTLRYMSPETLEGSVNLRNTWCLLQGDVYALGLLLWEILMRCSDLFQGCVVPKHLLPYESELGVNVTLESLIKHVCMDKRPSLPRHVELLPQGSMLQELLADCWDCDPEARLSAQCAVERLDTLMTL